MLDGGRIVGGIAILLVLIAGPAWVASVQARGSNTPREAAKQGPCIEPRAAMLRNHPIILDRWRQQAVRAGVRVHHSNDGRAFPASLSGGCLHCHQTAEGFCTRCHAEVGVSLNCWACHKDSPGESPSPPGNQRPPRFAGPMPRGTFD